jgi:hypothetical protein
MSGWDLQRQKRTARRRRCPAVDFSERRAQCNMLRGDLEQLHSIHDKLMHLKLGHEYVIGPQRAVCGGCRQELQEMRTVSARMSGGASLHR